MMDAEHVVLAGVTKSFHTPVGTVAVLSGVDARIRRGEHVAIVGPSGSGKSTLLALIAGLDTADAGCVQVGGTNIATLGERDMAQYRNKDIGIIFQSFELVTPFTVEENVSAPLDIAHLRNPERVEALLERVSLTHRRDAYPRTLSGGEKQRVAIARALVNAPALILADEPTGSLDRITGGAVFELLLEEVTREGATLIVITHDHGIAARMDRVLELKEGRLYEDE